MTEIDTCDANAVVVDLICKDAKVPLPDFTC